MRYVIVLVSLIVMVFFINLVENNFTHQYGDSAVLVLGFVLLSSFLVGRLVRRAKMPMITGYLLAGLFFGPHIIGRINPHLTLFTDDVLSQLRLIDELALGLIAFTAGGELRLRELRKRFSVIVSIVGAHTVVVFCGVTATILLFAPMLALTAGQPAAFVWAAAILLGIAAMAISPATAIAVINETGAKGQLTTVLMGVTILKDVVTLVVFSFGLVIARKLLDPGEGFAFSVLLHVLWEVFGSLLIGVAIGMALRFYIGAVAQELPILVLAVAYLSMEFAPTLGVSGILVCVAAGFYVENFSDRGDQLIRAVEHYSLPVYVVFFTVAGAKINLPLLGDLWLTAVLLIVARTFFTFVGSYAGARLANGTPHERRLSWMGFIGQAGITLGLATIIRRVVPGIGPDLASLIIATIAVNQLLGPIMLRYALYRSGDAKR
jgi:NhaP-type Na+/H+ or K+/H+ antiporter